MILTREEQRIKQSHNQMLSIQLDCHLHNLISDILKGDANKLPEFQQFIQYAPPEMKLRMIENLEKLKIG